MPIHFEGITLYNVPEIAEKLNVSENTVRDYLKAGKLKGKKLGKKWFITAESIREYFEQPGGEDELGDEG